MVSLVMLAVLVLLPTTIAMVTTARRNCPNTCGSEVIPYPFGLDPSCSLPGFNLTCAVDKNTNESSLMLGMGNSILKLSRVYVDANFNLYVNTILSYSTKMIPGVRDYSIHWEAPARPFAISGSSNMSLFVVGCDVTASLYIGNSAVQLPVWTCDGMVGIGCCSIGIQVNLRAFTLNISCISDSPRPKQVQAFIAYNWNPTFRPIDAYSGLLERYVAQLDWSIPYQPNCKHAIEDKDNYACVSDHNKCQDSPIGGYLCYCQSGRGNAYIDGGCHNPPAAPVYDSLQPRTNCPTSCGNMSIPFPFGIELGCFAKPHLYLACTPGTTILLVLKMTARKLVTDISIDDGILQVHEVSGPGDFMAGSNTDSTLYVSSGKSGVIPMSAISQINERVSARIVSEAIHIQNEYGEKQNLSNYFLWAMRERPLEETVDAQILDEANGERVLCMARLAEECLCLTRAQRPTMKDVEMRLQLLAGRRVAPRVERGDVAQPHSEAAGNNGHGGIAPVIGQNGSRQFSQEQEFALSLRVPR
ncbi:wall-associated receptor kinase 5-like [Triticum dicoccoides]|uniref:wall-associated receptor kinase 5-like n=1 Tax=Triticum dicoccoides TaxID=85692 RepID=UPI00188F6640|nr:wall-associated receptor kinase 5-like [Triticum dicoccoides]